MMRNASVYRKAKRLTKRRAADFEKAAMLERLTGLLRLPIEVYGIAFSLLASLVLLSIWRATPSQSGPPVTGTVISVFRQQSETDTGQDHANIRLPDGSNISAPLPQRNYKIGDEITVCVSTKTFIWTHTSYRTCSETDSQTPN
jgi:hypothetical protein